MEIAKISEAATHAGIIATFLTGGIAWLLIRVNKLKEWQMNAMRREINDIFENDIMPLVVQKSTCEGTHKLTDSNMHYIRQDLAELKKTNSDQHTEVKGLLQVLIEGIVKKNLNI